MDDRAISAQQVLDFLNKRSLSKQLDMAQLQQREAYRHAAAVLAGIDNISSLKPVGGNSSSDTAAELLRDDLVPVRAKRLGGKLMLSADVRRPALAELVAESAILLALAANPNERTGTIQTQFESYLTGNPKPIEQQTLSELEDSCKRCCGWRAFP